MNEERTGSSRGSPVPLEPHAGDMSLGRATWWIVGSLARRWWVLLSVLVASISASATVTSMMRPVFRATAMAAVAPNSEVSGVSDVMRSLETLERRTILVTFARLPGSSEVRAAVAQRLSIPAGEIARYRVSAALVPYTNILRIDVEGPDGSRAAEVAEAVTEETRRRARKLYRIFTLRSIEAPRASRQPVRPDWSRNLIVGSALGLFLGALAAVAVDRSKTGRRRS